MRFFNLTLLAFYVSTTVLGQPDPVREVTGKIINESTKETVEANFYYELQPYGDEVGLITVSKESNYDIYLRGEQEYKIRVEAEGYFPYVETYKVPAEGEDVISKDIYIRPGGVGYVQKLENLIFAQGSAEINESSYSELDDLADILEATPTMVVQLEGHTDPQGSASGNMILSQQRVDAVRDYLINKGIDGERIKTKAFGGTQPISRESTPEARAANRRVEVRILSL